MQSKNQYQIFNQSCIEGMREHVADNSVDLIFTDPPYGIDGDGLDVHYHRDESNVVPGYIDVPQSQYAEFTRNWINECERVLRPGGSMYIVSGYTNLHHVLNALHDTKLCEVNHLIAKYTFGVNATKKWISGHYHILFWEKPGKGKQQRTFNHMYKWDDNKDSYNDRLSVQDMPRAHNPGQTKNKNQLSEEFIEKFIMYSSNRGDTVLDCFGGGLTTARTALRYGRNFVGFELNKNAYDAFVPGLADVEELPDPPKVSVDPVELARRNKMRAGWAADRAKKKAEKSTKVVQTNKVDN
jgi:site-specific DNA-methyltransferase (adenine-specific)